MNLQPAFWGGVLKMLSTRSVELLALLVVMAMLVGGAGCASKDVETAPPIGSGETTTLPHSATPNIARDIARGKRLAQEKGCLGCHTTDGRDQVGPTWKKLYGKTETVVGNGIVNVDEAYLRESIVEPNSQVVEGFRPDIMPGFELADGEIEAIIAYIRSLQ